MFRAMLEQEQSNVPGGEFDDDLDNLDTTH